jgi:hypothetical protein
LESGSGSGSGSGPDPSDYESESETSSEDEMPGFDDGMDAHDVPDPAAVAAAAAGGEAAAGLAGQGEGGAAARISQERGAAAGGPRRCPCGSLLALAAKPWLLQAAPPGTSLPQAAATLGASTQLARAPSAPCAPLASPQAAGGCRCRCGLRRWA